MFIAGAYFFVYAAQFLSYSLRQKAPAVGDKSGRKHF